MGNRCPSRL